MAAYVRQASAGEPLGVTPSSSWTGTRCRAQLTAMAISGAAAPHPAQRARAGAASRPTHDPVTLWTLYRTPARPPAGPQDSPGRVPTHIVRPGHTAKRACRWGVWPISSDRMTRIALVALGGLLACGPALAAEAREKFRLIEVPELESLQKDAVAPVTVLDANDPEFREKHGVIPGARLLSSFDSYDPRQE